jgi:arylsulfatase A-like enzyme
MHIYEESIRVPLAMRGPGIPRGVRIGDLAINVDLAPTIVDAANAHPGLVMDGRSLIPVARHPGIERGRQLLVEEPTFEAIRTRRYMYAEHDTGERELYDLRKDRFELRSRHQAPAYASVMAQLAIRLHELQSCAGASCRIHQQDPQPQAQANPKPLLPCGGRRTCLPRQLDLSRREGLHDLDRAAFPGPRRPAR